MKINMPEPRECTECGEVHGYPTPRFQIGDRCVVVDASGYHHRDKVGQTVVIDGANTSLMMPCDGVEYWVRTEDGERMQGAVAERRLQPASE